MTKQARKQEEITLNDVYVNLQIAALEWRGAIAEKRRLEKEFFENQSVELAVRALKANKQAKRIKKQAYFALGLQTVFMLASIAIAVAHVI